MKTLLFLILIMPLMALPKHLEKGVVYVEEFSDQAITLKTISPSLVYSSSKGGRSRGNLKEGANVELISFTEKAYFVRGKKSNGEGISGWVAPATLTSNDPKFVEKLKNAHTRQLLVRQLTEKGEVALGMTTAETQKILGKPTKTTSRQDANGRTEVWEYIETEEISHFVTERDPFTGGIYRRLSHVSTVEKSKSTVEFTGGFVTALENSESNRRGRQTVTAPVIFTW